MIRITHTFTKDDVDLIAGHLARSASAAVISRIRWPFRMAYLLAGIFLVVLGCGLLRTNTMAGLTCLIIGLAGIYRAVAPPLLARLTVSKVRQAMLSRIGSTVTWEIGDDGITIGTQRMAWSKFESYKVVDSGVLIDGSNLVFIPAGAVSDPSVKSQLAEILERHFGSLPSAQALQ